MAKRYLCAMPEVLNHPFREAMLRALQIEATEDQLTAIDALSDFLQSDSMVFLLKGYAGTGKTTLVSALTKVIPSFILLAPTGRAAKVLASYSRLPASTIHRHIYKVTAAEDGQMKLLLSQNKKKNTVFIIDESSMIGTNSADDVFGSNLLDDLIRFVSEGRNCKMLLVGDTAQLPPVHASLSPALDIDNLKSLEHNVRHVELKKVVRQREAGGILLNATALRILIARGAKVPVLKTNTFDDIRQISGYDVADELERAYRNYGADEVLVITRSNKNANQYNQLIRRQIFAYDEEISAGDRLMVVKNNYTWLEKDSGAGFIANGDTVEVEKLLRTEEKHGLRFATMQVKMIDYPDEPSFETVILLDTLYSETPSLNRQEQSKLYESVLQQYASLTKGKRREAMRSDAYLNALQVKFAYAVTCHKAQGGQWKSVFIDQGFITEEMQSTAHLRWLYTACTRASEQLLLINFHESLFKS